MEITKASVTLSPVKGTKLVGWGKITIDDIIHINGIKLFRIGHGDQAKQFIRFPERQISLTATNGEYVSFTMCNVTESKFRDTIIETLFKLYDEKKAQKNKHGEKMEPQEEEE